MEQYGGEDKTADKKFAHDEISVWSRVTITNITKNKFNCQVHFIMSLFSVLYASEIFNSIAFLMRFGFQESSRPRVCARLKPGVAGSLRGLVSKSRFKSEFLSDCLRKSREAADRQKAVRQLHRQRRDFGQPSLCSCQLCLDPTGKPGSIYGNGCTNRPRLKANEMCERNRTLSLPLASPGPIQGALRIVLMRN
jgi:hypothetical protein